MNEPNKLMSLMKAPLCWLTASFKKPVWPAELKKPDEPNVPTWPDQLNECNKLLH